MRKLFFESALAFCGHLITEISYARSTTSQIINQYIGGYDSRFSAMLACYLELTRAKCDMTRDAVSSIMPSNLHARERAVLGAMFYELGRHGAIEEREKLENRKAQLAVFHERSALALRKEASIYLKICILLGIAAVILLI